MNSRFASSAVQNRKNLKVGWSTRENVQVKLRLMVQRSIRKCKYPSVQQEPTVKPVLEQAKVLGETGRR